MTHSASPARILIVEDEAVIAKDVERCVTSHGHVVSGIVHTAEEAVAQSAGADLILMDVMLQGLHDGAWAAEQIRAARNVPVIFLTAFGDEETRADARRSDPHAHLLKPFEEDDLMRAIEGALAARPV